MQEVLYALYGTSGVEALMVPGKKQGEKKVKLNFYKSSVNPKECNCLKTIQNSPIEFPTPLFLFYMDGEGN